MSLEDKKKRILIIDGQGGGMGRQLTAALKASGVCAEITAVGTNALADALLGEVTPAMAAAVGQSAATRILVPVSHCDNRIAGMEELPMSRLVESAVRLAREYLEK